MPFLHIPLSYLFICSFDINRYCCFSDVFMKQTMYGWDHEVYLELGQNGENCLKWGANANKMTKSISLSNIEDLQIIDTNGMYNSYDFSTYCQFESRSWRGVLMARCTRNNIMWLAAGRWFSMGTPVSSTNKTGRHGIAEIVLKVALNTNNTSY